MDFNLSLPAFVHKYFTISKLTGHDKVTIVFALATKGMIDSLISSKELTKSWKRTTLRSTYSSAYLARAQERGWLSSPSKGTYKVTEAGIDHLLEIQKLGYLVTVPYFKSELQLFEAGQTHSFDKYLRKILAASGGQVRIADSYVDDTIFDNLLDKIPKNVRIHLMYGKSYGSFATCVARFSIEYPKFAHKQNQKFHDRLLIVDSVAYVLGPSLKDAADKSPASIVRLNSKDSQLITKFFDRIWKSI